MMVHFKSNLEPSAWKRKKSNSFFLYFIFNLLCLDVVKSRARPLLKIRINDIFMLNFSSCFIQMLNIFIQASLALPMYLQHHEIYFLEKIMHNLHLKSLLSDWKCKLNWALIFETWKDSNWSASSDLFQTC